jgi:hypothetical protein
MGLNLITMRASVYRICGVDEDDVETILADRLLNISWWEIAAKFKFRIKDTVAQFPLVVGSEKYTVPDEFEALRSIAVYDTENKSHYLQRVTSKWYQENYDSDAESRGFPTNYFREGNDIILWPTPDAVYTAVLRYTGTLADITEADGPGIPQEWHEAILYGACWRLSLELGDFQRKQALHQTQIAILESCIPVDAKEAADSRYANLEVIRPEYNL